MSRMFSSEFVALEEAKRVRNRLANTEAWEIEVFQNQHWYFTLHCGPISLRQFAPDSYGVLVNAPGCNFRGTGWPILSEHIKSKSTPQAAVQSGIDALDKIKDQVQVLRELCEPALRLVPPSLEPTLDE